MDDLILYCILYFVGYT